MSNLSSSLTDHSLAQWKNDLGTLLSEANRRFCDVTWSLTSDDGTVEQIHGHKAIIYARSGAQFQAKYLSSSARLFAQAQNHASSTSSLALPYASTCNSDESSVPYYDRSVSPGEASIISTVNSNTTLPQPQQPPIILRGTNATFFKSCLEYMYTSEASMSSVFTFIFDDNNNENKQDALSKLSQDMLYIWRSKLFADVQIRLRNSLINKNSNKQHADYDGDDGKEEEEEEDDDEAIFIAHRAILSCRCSYFANLMLSAFADSDNRILTLPSPPFTSASLHFVLGYIYAGTLHFSSRRFDLSTAFSIYRCSQFLGLDMLRSEVETSIQEMCRGKDGSRRAGRVLRFAHSPDVRALELAEHIKAIIVSSPGDTWNRDVGELDYDVQKQIVSQLCSTIDALNLISIFKASRTITSRLSQEKAQWADHIREMLEPVNTRINKCLVNNLDRVITTPDFINLIEGVGFSQDVLEALLENLVQNLTERSAANIYQVLVGQVLLRDEGLMSNITSVVENARKGIIRYLRTKWIGIRSYACFDPLQDWALKEISDEIEVPVDDLLAPKEDPLASHPSTPHHKQPLPQHPKSTPRRQSSIATTRMSSSANASSPGASGSTTTPRKSPALSRSLARTPNSASVTKPSKPLTAPTTTAPTSSNKATTSSSSKLAPSSASKAPSVRSVRSQATVASTTSAATTTTTSRLRTSNNRQLNSSKSTLQLPVSNSNNNNNLNSPSASTDSLITTKSNSTSTSTTSSKQTTSINGNNNNSNNKNSNESRSLQRAPSSVSLRSNATLKTISQPVTSPSPTPNTTTKTATSNKNTNDSNNNKLSVSTPNTKAASTTSVRSRASVASNATTRTNATTATTKAKSITQKSSASSSQTTTAPTSTTKRPLRPSSSNTLLRTSANTQKSTSSPSPASKTTSATTAKNATNKRTPTPVSTQTPGSSTNSTSSSTPATAPTSSSKSLRSVRSVRTLKSEPLTSNTNTNDANNNNNNINTSNRSTSPKRPTPIKTAQSQPPSPTKSVASVSSSKRTDENESTSDPSTPTASTPKGIFSEHHRRRSSVASNKTMYAKPAQSEAPPPPPSQPTLAELPSEPTVPLVLSPKELEKSPLSTPVVGLLNTEYEPSGTTLKIGIPCVVSTSKTKFQAVVKYLGDVHFAKGPWVGVEVLEHVQEDASQEELDWNDGTVDGIKYFDLRDPCPSSNASENGDSLRTPPGLNNSRPPSARSFIRRGSDTASIMSGASTPKPTIGLFLRPEQILL